MKTSNSYSMSGLAGSELRGEVPINGPVSVFPTTQQLQPFRSIHMIKIGCKLHPNFLHRKSDASQKRDISKARSTVSSETLSSERDMEAKVLVLASPYVS